MRALALYHATSFALMKTDKTVAEKWKGDPLLEDMLSKEHMAPLCKQFFADPSTVYIKLFLVLLSSPTNPKVVKYLNLPDNLTEDKLSKLVEITKSLGTLMGEYRKPKEDGTDVLIHGDFHMWNVAFQGSSNIRMFDFQLPIISNFAGDLNQFMSQAATPTQRKQQMPAFLKTYSTVFLKVCQGLGITGDLSQFSLEGVTKEYQRMALIGFTFGNNFVPPRFITNNETLEKAKKLLNDNAGDAELMAALEEFDSAFWENIQLFVDNVSEYIEHMLAVKQ